MRGVFANGNQIRILRKSFGLTQQDLSERAKLDVKTIRKAEQGNRIDLESLNRIAEVFQVDQYRLLSDASVDADGNYERVLLWSRTFLSHDREAYVNLYDPDAVLLIAGGGTIPFGGEYRGREAIGDATEISWRTVRQDPPNLAECTFIISGNDITLRGDNIVYLPNGQIQLFPCIMIFSFRNGLIIRQEVQFDTLDFAKKMEYTS